MKYLYNSLSVHVCIQFESYKRSLNDETELAEFTTNIHIYIISEKDLKYSHLPPKKWFVYGPECKELV